MIGAVGRGDSVVTGGGIIGKVTKVLDENRIQVEISDGVKVQIARATIADVISRGSGSGSGNATFPGPATGCSQGLRLLKVSGVW